MNCRATKSKVKTESAKHQNTWRRCLSRGSFQNHRYNARENWNKKEGIEARVSSRRAARGWCNSAVWVVSFAAWCVCGTRKQLRRKAEDSPKTFVSLAPRSLHDLRRASDWGESKRLKRGEIRSYLQIEVISALSCCDERWMLEWSSSEEVIVNAN